MIEHPEYATEGVSLSRFSFQIPKPLHEDYVRKRPARLTSSHDNARPLETGEGMMKTLICFLYRLKMDYECFSYVIDGGCGNMLVERLSYSVVKGEKRTEVQRGPKA